MVRDNAIPEVVTAWFDRARQTVPLSAEPVNDDVLPVREATPYVDDPKPQDAEALERLSDVELAKLGLSRGILALRSGASIGVTETS